MLSVRNMSVKYDGIMALTDVSITVEQGEIVTLIGSNGAGKSTLLQAIMNLIPIISGSVKVSNEETTNLKTKEILKKGVSLVPETRDIFPYLNVKDNLKLGLFSRSGNKCESDSFDNIYSLFPRLKEREKQQAGTLSGGEQQMLAIGRALMQQPGYLLLDEPSLGLSPKLTETLFEKISMINRNGTAILLVEQKARLALQVASRGYLLRTGKIVIEGNCKELIKSELVKKVYFGD